MRGQKKKVRNLLTVLFDTNEFNLLTRDRGVCLLWCKQGFPKSETAHGRDLNCFNKATSNSFSKCSSSKRNKLCSQYIHQELYYLEAFNHV